MPQKRAKWLFLFGVVGLVLLLDQVSKALVLREMRLYETLQPIPALVPFFQLTRIENTGAAFGFLPMAGDVFLILAAVMVGVMLFFYPRIPANAWWLHLAYGLVCGGALGNAIDRLQYGLVVDFIHYQIPGLISNVSNIADHAIVIGVLIVFADSFRPDPNQKGPEVLAQDSDKSL